MGIRKRQKSGFTIVELAVIITVIGILAGITVVGYGAWQKRTAENVVKTDLSNAVVALENARNFGNTYPLVIPSTFKPSDKVVIAGGASDINGAKGYCIQASSSQDTSVATMYVTSVSMTPQSGNCAAWSSLVGWWPMNGNTSDVSGNGNDGTSYGVTPTTGKNGQSNGAYSFTGINSYIVHNTNKIKPDSGTLAAWVNPTIQDGWGLWQTHDSTSVNWNDWISMFAYYGPFYYRIGNGSNCCSNDLTFTNSSYLPTNQWTYLTFTWGAGSMKIYKNGVLLGERGATFQTVIDPKARIGTGHGLGMQGVIDDFRIYDRPLTASDVLSLYQSGAQ